MTGYDYTRDYIIDLKRELRDVDQALVVDAIDDATEHLEMMVEDLMESGEAETRTKAVRIATRNYGSPRLIARGYIESDEELKEGEKKNITKRKQETIFQSMFNVYKDPHTYLGLIYFTLLFFLGIFYFIYIVVMLSVGLGLAITIIGLPLLFLFLLSVYGIAWLHGRMTEAMLGIRLPKKPRKMRVRGGAWTRVKTILKDPRLYSSLLYLFLMFPLGMVYFTVLISFLSASLIFFVAPIAASFGAVMGYPIGLPGDPPFLIAQMVFGWLLSIVTLTWTLHLSNLFGSFQGCLSRWLLLKR